MVAEDVRQKNKKQISWRVVLLVVAIIIVGYSGFVLYKIGEVRATKQDSTDFWFRDVGIGGLEAGVSEAVCDETCSQICLGPRPNTNPLNLTLFLPISRARICCHDACNNATCGQPRPTDTLCGHRVDGWAVLNGPIAGITTCVAEAFK